MAAWPTSGFPTHLFPLQPHEESPYLVVETAISGGSLEEYLKNAMAQTNGLVCALVSPICMAFSLPCPSGIGEPVSADTLTQWQKRTPSFFSEELCCNYLQYQDSTGPHLLLFDDETSLQKKCSLVQSLRIPFLIFSGLSAKKQPSE